MAYREPHIPDLRTQLTSIALVATRALNAGVREYAQQETDKFKDRIRRQSFRAFRDHPLSEKYLRRKILKGRDHRVMISTFHYLDAIRVHERRIGPGRRHFFIGHGPHDIAYDINNRPTRVKLRFITRIHEYGSQRARIPARTHWRPNLRRMQEEAPRARAAIGLRVKRAVQRRLQRMRR